MMDFFGHPLRALHNCEQPLLAGMKTGHDSHHNEREKSGSRCVEAALSNPAVPKHGRTCVFSRI